MNIYVHFSYTYSGEPFYYLYDLERVLFTVKYNHDFNHFHAKLSYRVVVEAKGRPVLVDIHAQNCITI